MKALPGIFLGVVLSVSVPAHAEGIPASGMDIAGLRIGMTEADAMAALRAFDPGAKVTRRTVASFPYFDGASMLQAPEFLDQLEVSTNGGPFRVWFTGLPSESRVFAVNRRGAAERPPGSEQFVSSLVSKYGPFDARSPARPGGQTVVQWGEEGKPQCTVGKDRAGQRVPAENSTGTLLPPQAAKTLEQQARQGYPHLREALGTAMDPARCGVVLRYEWLGDPVASFEAWLVDQGGMIAMGRQSAQWVEQLKADAVRAREGQGTVPRL